VKLTISKWSGVALWRAISVVLLGTLLYAASDIPVNEKVEVTGVILSRNGDTVRIKDKKSGQIVVVNITDSTKIERKKGHLQFFRPTDMNVTALVPGLTIEAEGGGDAKGRLEAEKISFSPDEFAVAVTEQPMLNKRVSELYDYKNEFQVDVFFARDSAVLDEKSKKDLDNLADIAKSLDGYLIEIAGYSSNTLSKEADQKVSEERAAVVAHYLREVKKIPMRRILVPVSYGATHPAVSNKDLYDRELNRHVDIKVLVNQSLGQGE
jgi:outer membrane protein OmpA-like peptidoglycan-associated protein